MVFKLHREDICIDETGSTYVLLKNISKSFDGNTMVVSDLTMEVKKGEFFSLLGPSGCGKTTLLRLIAGLEVPDKGIITLGENVASGQAWIPPEKRNVGIVFQDYALFPHMTVFKNVAFGLKGCSKEKLKQEVMGMLEMVGLSDLSQRYPHELSGGQQQRIALIRALAPSPVVILLDEPFSNLDTDLREEIASDTRRILKAKGTTAILVTHDQKEAFSLSDRVGVLNNGRLEQVGTSEEIYHKPATRFVANFVGRADFLSGRIEGESVISDIGVFKCEGDMPCDTVDVDLMIRPDDVDCIGDPSGNATVVDAQFLGAEIIYRLRLHNGTIIHSIKPSTNIIGIGSRVSITVDPAHIVVFKKDERG